MRSKKKIILCVTGSIAAFKSADIASRFVQKGLDVRVVMTKEAEAFITPLTLQMISRNKVYRDMFEAGDAWDVEHVSLAESADLVLIAPATANILGKLACGICDDLLTCIATATKAPILVAPAMNDGMYANKIVQANIERLKKIGVHFAGPVKGRLACGSVGMGRMIGVDEIIAHSLSLIRQ